MIYSFTVTKNFLHEVSSLKYDQIVKILDFIEENFLNTDGLYLQVDRSILEQKYGDISNDRIDNFLKTLSRFTKDIFIERGIKADIGLISKGEKNIASQYFTLSEVISDPKKIKKELKKLPNFWEMGESLLLKNLEKIFKSNKSIWYIDKYMILPFLEEIYKSKDLSNVISRKRYENLIIYLKSITNKNNLNFFYAIPNKTNKEIGRKKKDIKQHNKDVILKTLKPILKKK